MGWNVRHVETPVIQSAAKNLRIYFCCCRFLVVASLGWLRTDRGKSKDQYGDSSLRSE